MAPLPLKRLPLRPDSPLSALLGVYPTVGRAELPASAGMYLATKGRSVGRQAHVRAEESSPMDQPDDSTFSHVGSSCTPMNLIRMTEMATVLAAS